MTCPLIGCFEHVGRQDAEEEEGGDDGAGEDETGEQYEVQHNPASNLAGRGQPASQNIFCPKLGPAI